MQEQTQTLHNTKKVASIMKRIEFYIVIVTLIVSAALAWGSLQAKVDHNQEKIGETNGRVDSINTKLDDINKTLNHVDYGLPVLNQKIKALEE